MGIEPAQRLGSTPKPESGRKPPLERLAIRLQSRSPISGEERDALLSLPHSSRWIARGDYILREGDRPKHCYLLNSGFAYSHRIVGRGGRQVTGVQMSGDFLNLQNWLLDVVDENVRALTKSEVALIPREALLDLVFDHPAIGRALWEDTLIEASINREWTANIGRRDAKTRTAHLLCEFALRLDIAGLGEQSHYELPLTQEQLADALALTPAHLNRTLRALAAQGLITRTNRVIRIGIEDWDNLVEAGDFSSRYLHIEAVE